MLQHKKSESLSYGQLAEILDVTFSNQKSGPPLPLPPEFPHQP